MLRRFVQKAKSAQTAVEYMVLLGAVVGIVLIGFRNFSPIIQDTANYYYNQVGIGVFDGDTRCGDGICSQPGENCTNCRPDCFPLFCCTPGLCNNRNSVPCQSLYLDDCGQPGCSGLGPNSSQCLPPSSVTCNTPITDSCGNPVCGGGSTGTGINWLQCDFPTTVPCGDRIYDDCNNDCGTIGTQGCPCSPGACSNANSYVCGTTYSDPCGPGNCTGTGLDWSQCVPASEVCGGNVYDSCPSPNLCIGMTGSSPDNGSWSSWVNDPAGCYYDATSTCVIDQSHTCSWSTTACQVSAGGLACCTPCPGPATQTIPCPATEPQCPLPCPAQTVNPTALNECNVEALNHGDTSGPLTTCTSPFGSCQYTCNDGNLIEVSNNCGDVCPTTWATNGCLGLPRSTCSAPPLIDPGTGSPCCVYQHQCYSCEGDTMTVFSPATMCPDGATRTGCSLEGCIPNTWLQPEPNTCDGGGDDGSHWCGDTVCNTGSWCSTNGFAIGTPESPVNCPSDCGFLPCSATTINYCDLATTNVGFSDGTCASGIPTETCDYTCTATGWSLNSNNCSACGAISDPCLFSSDCCSGCCGNSTSPADGSCGTFPVTQCRTACTPIDSNWGSWVVDRSGCNVAGGLGDEYETWTRTCDGLQNACGANNCTGCSGPGCPNVDTDTAPPGGCCFGPDPTNFCCADPVNLGDECSSAAPGDCDGDRFCSGTAGDARCASCCGGGSCSN